LKAAPGSVLACGSCEAALSDSERVVSICGDVFGDEYIDTFYRCGRCGAYSRESYRDRFAGPPSVRVDALDASRAKAMIALVRGCSSRSDKHCGCAAHREYFGI
jgi:hypothetical protein